MNTPNPICATRLAPSPTGALHLGNARTFLINWLLAKQNGWRIILRIEDIDGPRIKSGADRSLIDDLEWLGLDWDEGPVYQTARTAMYRDAVERLVADGHAYPCVCSRKEVELAASAPHAEDGAAVYPGTCRDRFKTIAEARTASNREPAIRFRVCGTAALGCDNRPKHPQPRAAVPQALGVPEGIVTFHDEFRGPQSFDVAKQLGDFVIAKADGTPAYQLAVVVDDVDMNITDIVRGDDLIDSTPRQILLYRALGWEDRIPRYTHVPLIVGTDGRRLAKRHGDTRLSHYREQGFTPDEILRHLAAWCAIGGAGALSSPRDCVDRFHLDAVPRVPITFDPASGI